MSVSAKRGLLLERFESGRGEPAWQGEPVSAATGFKRMAVLCLAEEVALVGLLAFVYFRYCGEWMSASEMLLSLAFLALAIAVSDVVIYGVDGFIGARGDAKREKAQEFAVAFVPSTAVFSLAFAGMAIAQVRFTSFGAYELGLAASYGGLLTAFGLGVMFRPELDFRKDVLAIVGAFKRRGEALEDDEALIERLAAPGYRCGTCRFLDGQASEVCRGCELVRDWPTRYAPRAGTLQEKCWYRQYDAITDDEFERLLAEGRGCRAQGR